MWAAGVDIWVSATAQLTYVGPHVQRCVTWGHPHAMLEVRLLLKDLIPQEFDICLADAFNLQCMCEVSQGLPPPWMPACCRQTSKPFGSVALLLKEFALAHLSSHLGADRVLGGIPRACCMKCELQIQSVDLDQHAKSRGAMSAGRIQFGSAQRQHQTQSQSNVRKDVLSRLGGGQSGGSSGNRFASLSDDSQYASQHQQQSSGNSSSGHDRCCLPTQQCTAGACRCTCCAAAKPCTGPEGGLTLFYARCTLPMLHNISVQAHACPAEAGSEPCSRTCRTAPGGPFPAMAGIPSLSRLWETPALRRFAGPTCRSCSLVRRCGSSWSHGGRQQGP